MPSRSKSRLRSVTEQNKSDRENIGVMVDTKPNIVIVLREKTFIKQGARFSELVFSCNENSILGGRFCIYWKRSVFFVTSDHFIAGAFFIIVLNGRQLQQRGGPVGNGECGKSICNQMLFQVTGVWLSGSVRGVGALLTLWNIFFQELREQVERLEAELEDYKKGVPSVTALAPYRGRTQSWKGMLLISNSIAFLDWSLSVI